MILSPSLPSYMTPLPTYRHVTALLGMLKVVNIRYMVCVYAFCAIRSFVAMDKYVNEP